MIFYLNLNKNHFHTIQLFDKIKINKKWERAGKFLFTFIVTIVVSFYTKNKCNYLYSFFREEIVQIY